MSRIEKTTIDKMTNHLGVSQNSKFSTKSSSIYLRENKSMKRIPEEQNNYKIHRRIVNQFHKSWHGFMLTKIFGPSDAYTIVKNSFPYGRNPLVKHFCIWIHPDHEKYWKYIRIRSTCYSFAKKKRLKILELMENPFNERTVPMIKHYHFFAIPE